MSATLFPLAFSVSLDTWNPITVAGLLYVCGNVGVMLIRALKGDKTQTSLETQLGELVGRVATTEANVASNAQQVSQVKQDVGTIAKDFVPPQVVPELIRAHVVQALNQLVGTAPAVRAGPPPQQGQQATAVAVATAPAQPQQQARPRPAPQPRQQPRIAPAPQPRVAPQQTLPGQAVFRTVTNDEPDVVVDDVDPLPGVR